MAASKAVRALVVDEDPSLIGEYRRILCAGRDVRPESDGLFFALDSEVFGATVDHNQFPTVELAAFRRGQDAVDAVRDGRETNRPFSIAFVDMQLSTGLDGIETAERIRALDAQIQIAVLAGRGTLHPVEMVARVPPADRLSFVGRPFHPFEVQHLLLGSLHRRRNDSREPDRRAGGDRDGNRTILCAILDRLPVGVLVFDRHDRLIVVNAEMRRLFADTAPLFVPGVRYDDICRELSPESKAGWRTFGEQKVWQLPGARWAMVVEDGTPTGETYCLFCDVTDLRNRDVAYWRSMHSTHLTRVFSHLCASVEKLVTDNAAAADGADRVVSRLQAVAQQQHLRPRVLGLSRYLGRASRRLRRGLPAGIGLEVVLDSGLWSVEADPDGLARAMAELIANACEAMPNGGRILFEAANVRLTAESGVVASGLEFGDYVRLSVQDTGRGMPQHWAGRSLFPLPEATDGEHLGIGLSIVQAFAVESGGWLDILDGVGSGAAIHLYLPKVVSAEMVPAETKPGDIGAMPGMKALGRISGGGRRRGPPGTAGRGGDA